MLAIGDLRRQNLILLEAVSGSRAYGLDTPESDTDIKGVFYLPQRQFYGLDYQAQISDAGNDVVYYELGRFVELLLQSNPNILELLASPADCVRMRSPLMDAFRPEYFLSRACCATFAGYAAGQIRKARGLNKKIVNPMSLQKKTVLDFCFVIEGAQGIPLAKWLAAKGWVQQKAGLADVAHARGLYAVFYDEGGLCGYRGIMQKPGADSLVLSRIAPDTPPLAYLSFNQDGYSSYCREYASYRQWLRERNEVRYRETLRHGQAYDAKNMMHTFRLLETACDLARYGEVRVRRPNREELLAIKRGVFSYEELTLRAQTLLNEAEALFAVSALPALPDRVAAAEALVGVRRRLYGGMVD